MARVGFGVSHHLAHDLMVPWQLCASRDRGTIVQPRSVLLNGAELLEALRVIDLVVLLPFSVILVVEYAKFLHSYGGVQVGPRREPQPQVRDMFHEFFEFVFGPVVGVQDDLKEE